MKPTRTAGLALALGLAVATVVAVPGPASAETVTSATDGASLSLTFGSIAFPAATLTGATQNLTSTPGSAWTLQDSRGASTGLLGWSATISATAPTSAAGTVETTARTIPVGRLKVSTGTVTAGAGSDPTTHITGASNLAMSGSAQTLISASATTKGTYTFTPSFGLEVRANAFRSNYSGAIGASALNPYVSTLTLTIS